jgi:hypothetical protein
MERRRDDPLAPDARWKRRPSRWRPRTCARSGDVKPGSRWALGGSGAVVAGAGLASGWLAAVIAACALAQLGTPLFVLDGGRHRARVVARRQPGQPPRAARARRAVRRLSGARHDSALHVARLPARRVEGAAAARRGLAQAPRVDAGRPRARLPRRLGLLHHAHRRQRRHHRRHRRAAAARRFVSRAGRTASRSASSPPAARSACSSLRHFRFSSTRSWPASTSSSPSARGCCPACWCSSFSERGPRSPGRRRSIPREPFVAS